MVKSEIVQLTGSEHKRACSTGNYTYGDTNCIVKVGVDANGVDQRPSEISDLNQVYPTMRQYYDAIHLISFNANLFLLVSEGDYWIVVKSYFA